jgi:hypothetical protein
MATEKHWVLWELHREKATLEQIFRELTGDVGLGDVEGRAVETEGGTVETEGGGAETGADPAETSRGPAEGEARPGATDPAEDADDGEVPS